MAKTKTIWFIQRFMNNGVHLSRYEMESEGPKTYKLKHGGIIRQIKKDEKISFLASKEWGYALIPAVYTDVEKAVISLKMIAEAEIAMYERNLEEQKKHLQRWLNALSHNRATEIKQ